MPFLDSVAAWSEAALDAVRAGGAVAVVLVGCAFALGYALVTRAVAVHSTRAVVRDLGTVDGGFLSLAIRGARADAAKAVTEKGAALIRTLVMVAPLLGLLGTVIGMIETFSALSDTEVFARADGMSNGVSQALLTTQLGLVVAIPGLLLSRWLDRWSDACVESIEAAMRAPTSHSERIGMEGVA